MRGGGEGALVEYLLVPAAGAVLVGLLAVQFLLVGVSYGPRARRLLLLLAMPAAVAGAAVGVVLPLRALALRMAAGLITALVAYLALAASAILAWRERRIRALVGDVGAIRRRLATRQREMERLLWAAAPPAEPEPASELRGEDWAAQLQEWLASEPADTARRRAQAAEWQAEFRRAGRAALAARAKVLEAAWREAPEGPDRLARGARLAALWLAFSSLTQPRVEAAAPSAGVAGLAELRADVAHLQEELAHMLELRQTLLRRRLPLE